MDRTLRGLAAGLIGSVVMNIWNLLSFYTLNLADKRFIDWSSTLVFGRMATSFSEIMLSLIFQVVWSSFFGVIFALLIPTITSQAYIIKGAVFGFLLSFIFYIVPMLFRVPFLAEATVGTVITEMVGGTIWGITTAVVLAYLSKYNRLVNG
ncbi:MAG: hypothetical protein KGZ96_12130 [Clostridia bacterium]|nr:hypothetical protein [Clostridia bacterium]